MIQFQENFNWIKSINEFNLHYIQVSMQYRYYQLLKWLLLRKKYAIILMKRCKMPYALFAMVWRRRQQRRDSIFQGEQQQIKSMGAIEMERKLDEILTFLRLRNSILSRKYLRYIVAVNCVSCTTVLIACFVMNYKLNYDSQYTYIHFCKNITAILVFQLDQAMWAKGITSTRK